MFKDPTGFFFKIPSWIYCALLTQNSATETHSSSCTARVVSAPVDVVLDVNRTYQML